MSRIRSLRTLVAVRRRERDRLQQDLVEKTRRQAQARSAQAEAQLAHGEHEQREQALREERVALLSRSFTPHAVRALDYTATDLARETGEASKRLESATTALGKATAEVDGARAALRRNEQRLEGFETLLAQALKEEEQRRDDAVEEEAEETSVVQHAKRAASRVGE